MKHILVIRCATGHEQRIEYDERYSLDVVQAFGAVLCGGEAPGIVGDDGHPLEWHPQTCGLHVYGVPPKKECGERLSFEIDRLPK